MIEQTLPNDMVRYERDGRWCEVGHIRYSYFNEQPCYEIDGRGDMAFYLGDTDPLDVRETEEGWTCKYLPFTGGFQEFADTLIRLGAWA